MRKISRCGGSRSPNNAELIWSFHVAVLPRTAKKYTKNYNVRARLLFCSSNLLFDDVLVAVVVVFCVTALKVNTTATRKPQNKRFKVAPYSINSIYT